MFSLSNTVLSSNLRNFTSESALLLFGNCGDDGKLGSWCSNEVVIRKKRVCERFVRSVVRISCKHSAVRALVHSDFPNVKTSEKKATYRFMMETGGHLIAIVHKKANDRYGIQVEVECLEGTDQLQELVMVWGMFRADSNSLLSHDSKELSSTGCTETPLVLNSAGRLAAELIFKENLAPFYVSVLLKSQLGSTSSTIRSHRDTSFVVPIGFGSGSPYPLGVSFLDDGSVNLAFYSGNVDRVFLCLYADEKADKPSIEIDLDSYVNRTGDVWHALMYDSTPFLKYGYRCRGVSHSHDHNVLLDPYSKFTHDSGAGFLGKSLGRVYKEPPFDWSGEIRPNLLMEKLIIYRLNVTQFTKDGSSNLPTNVSGSFSGISEKVQHFIDLNVNAILLEPIFPFDAKKGAYFPCHFFSPSNLFAASNDPNAAVTSLKEMVKKLHANGIEVLLEVVFTHASEGGASRETDESSHYQIKGGEDMKLTNTLNCNDPVIMEMILQSLRYWVTEFHVDGFCFMNASAMLEGSHGETLSRPPLIEAISFDPLLSKVKLIVDFWGPHSMEIEETLFPHWKRWAEMNSKFCTDVRKFLKGECPLSNFATRLCGSGDLFLAGRGPAFSFNYITRNVGLSLVDLVSFSSIDSESSEFSWNCGEEGPSRNSIVLETRLKQIRNFLFILFLSLGVPVLNMGDECGESASGSLLSSERQPLNWNAMKSSFSVQIRQFISFLSLLKARRSDLLQRNRFLEEERIEWRGSQQSLPNWDDPSSKFLAMILKAKTRQTSGLENHGGDLFIGFNSGNQTEKVVIPQPAPGSAWFCLVDTGLLFPGFFAMDGVPLDPQKVTYEVKFHSCVLFEARRSSVS